MTGSSQKQYKVAMVDSSRCAALTFEVISLDLIYTSPHQMRRQFDSEALKELAASMQQEGLIQPITVRKVGDAYELIVGERRLRAARMLGWPAIDARIMEISDEDAAVKGLIENLQRTDLSPIEEARGYKQLTDPPYNLSLGAVARRVGKSEASVARGLALLELPEEIQALLLQGTLTESHARPLRKIPERSRQVALARQAHRQGWTAKELERRVCELLAAMGMPAEKKESHSPEPSSDPFARIWKSVESAADKVGIKVSAVQQKQGCWTLKIDSKKAANPRRALADLFIRIGHSLNSSTRPG